MVEFQDGTGKVAMKANVDEALALVKVTADFPAEEHFASAADPIVAVNHQVPASIPIMIEPVAAFLLPNDEMAGGVITGQSYPGFQKFRPCQRLKDAHRVGMKGNEACDIETFVNIPIRSLKISG